MFKTDPHNGHMGLSRRSLWHLDASEYSRTMSRGPASWNRQVGGLRCKPLHLPPAPPTPALGEGVSQDGWVGGPTERHTQRCEHKHPPQHSVFRRVDQEAGSGRACTW